MTGKSGLAESEALRMLDVVKIIVDGPFSSGKTTFVRSASEYVYTMVNVEIPQQSYFDIPIQPRNYFAVDFGLIKSGNDLAVLLLGTPSALRIEVDSHFRNHAVLGNIFMVDSTYPGTFREAKAIIEFLGVAIGKPFVVAANKQDLPGAWSLDDFRLALQIPPKIPVLPCVATDRESVKRVLVALLDELLRAAE